MAWKILYLALLFPLTSAANDGTLTVFRWNEGYRAEREPVLERTVTEGEFRSMMAKGELPKSDEIFRGCYLAHYRANPSRVPAESEVKPKTEIYKICIPAEKSVFEKLSGRISLK